MVIGALLLALVVQWALIRPYKIPSKSMAPTLVVGQRVFVDRLGAHLGDPSSGQIIVFHPPPGAELPASQEQCGRPRPSFRSCTQAVPGKAKVTFIKRLVGMPGDRIALRGGHVIRNGRAIPEPYAQSCAEPICNLEEVTVPAGSYFMLGDNRDDSDDSRYWGAVPRANIIGRAVATYWPLKRAGGLH